jgi:hypothetical protein
MQKKAEFYIAPKSSRRDACMFSFDGRTWPPRHMEAARGGLFRIQASSVLVHEAARSMWRLAPREIALASLIHLRVGFMCVCVRKG